MDVLAALLPPVVVALAFIAIGIAVFRYTNRSEPPDPPDADVEEGADQHTSDANGDAV
jgi:hypothetical protein